jgi:hypothetical protein
VKAPPRQILLKRQSAKSALLLGLKAVFSSKPVFNVKPPLFDSTLVFCPYDLHEELKLKFSFLQRDDRVLYNLLTTLPFTKSKDVEQHLKELARVKFN